MNPHSDDEPILGKNPIICSISLGATRTFYLERKRKQCQEGICDKIKIKLSNGSLLIMFENVQEDFVHSIPKEPERTGARINLTFRKFIPDFRYDSSEDDYDKENDKNIPQLKDLDRRYKSLPELYETNKWVDDHFMKEK